MTTKSQRAERIDLVRDLIVLGVERKIQQQSELKRIGIEEGILIRESDGRPFNDTSVYRYLDAIRFLKFDDSEKYSAKDNIEWTPSARELAKCGTANFRRQTLSEAEKAILRRNIFLSDAREQFLKCFCRNKFVPSSQEEFITLAHPLYIINSSDKKSPGMNKTSEVKISLNPDGGKIIQKPKREFLYTYRYWGLDTAIIDELNIREAARCGVPKARSYILYPLDPTINMTPDRFLEEIYASLGHQLKQPRVVPVPWLMYRICPKIKISVETFKTLLLETWQQNRHLLHLERGPGGLIEGKIYAAEREFSQRYGNHRYYSVVNGTIRSNVAVFPIK